MPIKFFHRLSSNRRSRKTNIQLGAYLAFLAGAVNAGGFLAISRYTSHMSGIISGIGDDLALRDLAAVLGALTLLIAFIAGAATTAVLVNWGQRRKIQSEFALPLLVEAALLLIFGVVGANLNLYLHLTMPAIALLLCFVMGLQNAIMTKASGAEIRTTHMTGVVTDIGIELGKLFYWNRSTEANARGTVMANRIKLKTHLLIFSAFFSGAIVGAVSFKELGYQFVIPLSLSLVVIAASHIYKDIRLILKQHALHN